MRDNAFVGRYPQPFPSIGIPPPYPPSLPYPPPLPPSLPRPYPSSFPIVPHPSQVPLPYDYEDDDKKNLSTGGIVRIRCRECKEKRTF